MTNRVELILTISAWKERAEEISMMNMVANSSAQNAVMGPLTGLVAANSGGVLYTSLPTYAAMVDPTICATT